MKIIVLVIIILLSISCQRKEETRAEYLCSLVSSKPDFDFQNTYGETFKKSFSEEKLTSHFEDLYKKYGPCQKVLKVEGTDSYNVILELKENKRMIFNVVESDGEITGLWFKGVSSGNASFNKYAKYLCDFIVQKPNWNYQKIFGKRFRKAVPEVQFAGLFGSIYNEFGSCKKNTPSTSDGISGEIITEHEKGIRAKFKLTVGEEDGVSKILGLRFMGKYTAPLNFSSFKEIEELAQKKKGTFSILFQKLEGAEIFNFKSNERHALGSLFKLYILAAVIEKIEAGELSWDKKYKIQEKLKSLPSGKMQNLKEGSEATLREFATKMISISDNTATDHILNLVTKKYVEELIEKEKFSPLSVGFVPFLSTLDLFKIRGYFKKSDTQKYLISSKIERSKMIKEIPFKSREALLKRLEDWKGPRNINEIEWYSTPKEICALYKWADDKKDEKLRKVLGLNTPFVNLIKSKRWSYVGYKGGSEPGVIEVAYIFEDKKGERYCLYMGQNNSEEVIENSLFFNFLEGVLKFLDKL